MSLKALVREAVVADLAQHRALAEAAVEFRRFVAQHASALDEAFPDSAPRPAAGPATGAA